MKLSSFAVFVAAIACVAPAIAGSYSFKEPFTQSAPFQPDGSLSLENVNGSVEIRAWDRNEIRIEGEKSAATDEELKKIELTMDVSEARADIKVRLPKRIGSWFGGGNIRGSVRFTITLPATASVKSLEVVNASVTISGITGGVNAESVNGRIKASGLAGDVHLETVNGSVEAEFAAVNGAQDLKFETVNGSVTVALPSDTGASVHAETVNGRISSDFPLTTKGAFIGRKLDGTIGDGRASLHAETVNGGITLKRS